MIKKFTAAILAAAMLFALCIPASAQDARPSLRFGDDGRFTIVHLTDSHIHFPMEKFKKQYICEMLDTVKPDIVVLGGDTITDSNEATAVSDTPFEDACRELCSLFAEREIPFTITFGNHDRQFGIDGETLLAYYTEYGGGYFLGYDADPGLYGCGTHDLPVLSSDGSRVALDLFMMDSGDSVFDENNNRLGYDSVHPDEIEWYKNRAAELKEANGGETVPSMVFQHIIVPEIDDMLFYDVRNSAGALGEDFDGKHILFTPIPKIHNIKSGVIMEKPCPGYYNYGQLAAMQETGDVIAVFSGHDHSNTFTVNIGGIDVVNTGGCKTQAPLRLFTSGVRVITVDENDPRAYESSMLSFTDLAKAEGSEIFPSDDISGWDIFLTGFWEVLTRFVISAVRIFAR